MADIDLYIPFLEKWEGGFAHHPADRGGATCKGVTLATWQQLGTDKDGDGVIGRSDLRLIGRNDLVERVLRPHFWNRWQADRIRTQSIAELLVDWMWMSGPYTIRLAQKELKVEMDGVVGNRTLYAINNCIDQHNLFYRLKVARYAHLYRIVGHRPANKVFLEGWLNRVRDLKFSLSLAALVVASLTVTGCRQHRLIAEQSVAVKVSDSTMQVSEAKSEKVTGKVTENATEQATGESTGQSLRWTKGKTTDRSIQWATDESELTETSILMVYKPDRFNEVHTDTVELHNNSVALYTDTATAQNHSVALEYLPAVPVNALTAFLDASPAAGYIIHSQHTRKQQRRSNGADTTQRFSNAYASDHHATTHSSTGKQSLTDTATSQAVQHSTTRSENHVSRSPKADSSRIAIPWIVTCSLLVIGVLAIKFRKSG